MASKRILLLAIYCPEYPIEVIHGYKFFDNIEECKIYMRNKHINPNLNNGYRHKIIDLKESMEMPD